MIKNIVLGLVYLFALFMAWSAFQWLGIIYVLLVPLPLIVFSYLIQKNKGDSNKKQKTISLWTSPIPYLSLFFVAIMAFYLVA